MYYKVNIKRRFPEDDRVLGHANGEFVPNHQENFERISNGEIIYNAPIFDYFHLQNFGPKEDWEWRLQDIHGGIGEYPRGGYWYISDKLKTLLDNFKIAFSYFFYETKLLYKGDKFKYWIFQFPINHFQNINFKKSIFNLENDSTVYSFENREDYLAFYRKEYRSTKRELKCSKLILNDNFDLVVSSNNDRLVSPSLKNSIEQEGLTGFEFLEIDYEVGIEK